MTPGITNELSELPFYDITTHELVTELLFPCLAVKAEICQNDSFYGNITTMCNNSIMKELDFSYSTEDEFNYCYKQCASLIELSVFHVNIRSLNKNHRKLIHFLQSLDITFDIIILSEIWKYNLEFYHNILKNYSFYYEVSDCSNVGGIGIYVKEGLSCQQMSSLNIPSTNDNKVESLWLELTNGDNKYIVAGIYRHPNQNIANFNEKIEQCLETICKSNIPCIIAGDINIDLSNYCKNRATSNYVDNVLTYNFMPTIVMPTRITPKSATIVDHIYYYEGKNCRKELGIKSGNFWNDMTDHLPNYFLLLNKHKIVKQQNKDFVRIFSEKNLQSFRTEINKINWEPMYSYNDIDAAYKFFDESITACYNSSFPVIRLSRKRAKDKKWITAGLKTCSKRKNFLYKKWIQTRSAKDEANYKTYRRLYKKIASEAEESYFNKLFNTRSNSVKKLWDNLNTMCSFTSKNIKPQIAKLCNNNRIVTDRKEICNFLNEYFCTVGRHLADSLPPHTGQLFTEYLPPPTKSSMFCNPTTPYEVFRIINALNINKSPGPDNISPKIIKSVGDVIAEPLSFVYNLSFSCGVVPDALKISKVIPIYKKGERDIVGNYRPISILNTFEKILEKLMYKRLYEYLSVNHPLYKHQFGFRKHHSTSLALISVLDEIYHELDSGNVVLGIYFDLQKAFDTVDHSILLKN